MMARLALRNRLAVSFALALAVAYGALALCTILVVNRALSSAVDGRLSTVAQAIVTIAGDGRDEVDRKDRQQFASISADATGALVLDDSGAIVMSTTADIPEWVAGSIAHAEVGRIFTTRFAGHDLRVLVERRHKHDVNNTVVVWQSLQIVRDVEEALVLVLGGFGIVVVLGGYALGLQIARRGLLPLTRMTAIIADIAAHDLAARVGAQPHADELGQLAATFDRMLDRLQAAFERQRRFTADASHDLRAPLATLRAEVDLALRRERTVPEYRVALEAIADDADQLDGLIDALLAAARSEGSELAAQTLDLATLARGSIDEITAFARARGVTIAADLAPDCTICGDHDLLRRGVLAILHNAVKYTPSGGSIDVAVRREAQRIILCVRDSGPGFSDAALTHALDRFWREDAARTHRSGSGLGLAIADEIVRRCGGTIALENAAGSGAVVAIVFPAAAGSEPAASEPQRV